MHVKPGLPGTRELESGDLHATIWHENDHTASFVPICTVRMVWKKPGFWPSILTRSPSMTQTTHCIEKVSIGLHGTVSLHYKGDIQANVARIQGDTIRFHPDAYGHPRSAEWKAQILAQIPFKVTERSN